ncbi:CLUMA_CG015098, isoform A [Clunio marinus]|uniref:CLUMA_CG015098, isoform A n=1 Tax=Clunio marinus TaxID=568069 RepID=A0A1J1ITA0_9DIPT|nr:CLUMA_CG015098, isoform A [Clunio marinus]
MADEINAETVEEVSFIGGIVQEIVSSPLNIALVAIITFLVYKIFISRQEPKPSPPREPELPKLRRDFTASELKAYDGKQPDGRILVAVNGYVYDVTRGKRFYGPGGPYAAFGGRDASRGLATFSVTTSEVEYDDLSDLTPPEMDSVREWEMQFKEKYDLVGRLLKPGEQPTNYSDEDDEPTGSSDKSGTEHEKSESDGKKDDSKPEE